jgi:hypothetical protein
VNARTLGTIAAILAALSPSPARAADEDDPKALVVRGVERYKHEDYEAARAAFARAYELAPSTRTLFNLCLAELLSLHPLESVRHMRAYIAAPDAEPEKIEILKAKWLPRAEAQTSRLRIEAPVGAEVFVDGHLEGHGPLTIIDVSVGDHDVVAGEGAWSRLERVGTRAGAVTSLRLERPVSAEPVSASSPPLAPLRSAGTPVPLPAAELLTEVALLSSAAIATSLGVAFAIASNNDAKNARTLLAQVPVDPISPQSQCLASPVPPQCPRLQADNRDATHAARLSYGFYIGAGVLGAAAVVTWLVWPSHVPTQGSASFFPVGGPGRLGFVVQAHW